MRRRGIASIIVIIVNTLLFAIVAVLTLLIFNQTGPQKTPSSVPTPTPLAQEENEPKCLIVKNATSVTKITRGTVAKIQLLPKKEDVETIEISLQTKKNLVIFSYSKKEIPLIIINQETAGKITILNQIAPGTNLQIEESFEMNQTNCPNIVQIRIVSIEETAPLQISP